MPDAWTVISKMHSMHRVETDEPHARSQLREPNRVDFRENKTIKSKVRANQVFVCHPYKFNVVAAHPVSSGTGSFYH